MVLKAGKGDRKPTHWEAPAATEGRWLPGREQRAWASLPTGSLGHRAAPAPGHPCDHVSHPDTPVAFSLEATCPFLQGVLPALGEASRSASGAACFLLPGPLFHTSTPAPALGAHRTGRLTCLCSQSQLRWKRALVQCVGLEGGVSPGKELRGPLAQNGADSVSCHLRGVKAAEQGRPRGESGAGLEGGVEGVSLQTLNSGLWQVLSKALGRRKQKWPSAWGALVV